MIRFRRLYDYNPLEGTISFAVVTYIKRPYLMKTYVATIDGISEFKEHIAQYEKRLIIDLWLCVIGTTWLTKESDPPKS